MTGYIYVLVHPSDPDLYKIGRTSRTPEDRLREHNSDRNKLAGKIVKETGQKWELKTSFAVPDPVWAETVFWANTHWGYVPFRGGVEIQRMNWTTVEEGLEAAKKAGLRPPPTPTPDYVYANTAWMKKQLTGRGISVQGLVKSKNGKSTFRCRDGHEWRSANRIVAEGEGCPSCGLGKSTPAEIRKAAKPGVLCLLVRSDKPGVIKIGLTDRTREQCWAGEVWPGWEIHRFRNVDEPQLAEALIWELLGCPAPQNGETDEIELSAAEQGMRDLNGRMDAEIALLEKARND